MEEKADFKLRHVADLQNMHKCAVAYAFECALEVMEVGGPLDLFLARYLPIIFQMQHLKDTYKLRDKTAASLLYKAMEGYVFLDVILLIAQLLCSSNFVYLAVSSA